ncbi:MAG: ATP-binding protein, partial [Gammaproteobacteria bacterium]|nr:ATP-binding protein [Gammaproteobacteria bacterium]
YQTPLLIWASNSQIQQIVQRLIQSDHSKDVLIASKDQKLLRDLFLPYFNLSGFKGYFIISKDGVNLASSRDVNIGQKNLLLSQKGFLEKVWNGSSLISLPIVSDVPLTDVHGHVRDDLASIFTATPIQDTSGHTIAILAFRIDPDEGFKEIFSRSHFGISGESYAVNQQGVLLTDSRFNARLVELGLLESGHHADLKLEIRDPGVDLTITSSPVPRKQQPFTTMANSIINMQSSLDLQGYRDYRGVEVVGAWLWDDKLGFGITTELDKKEAYHSIYRAKFTIISLSSLLIFSIVLLWYLFIVIRNEILKNAELAESAKASSEIARQEAERANSAKSDFLASMSHELRTPLNSILGFAQLLKMEPIQFNEDQSDYINHIQSSGEHLLSLINEILDLARIEAGKLTLAIESISANEAIAESIPLVTNQAQKDDITINYDEGSQATYIRADRTRLRQVLLNLLSNAVKYNIPSGVVTISTELLQNDRLRISITDTGLGIPELKQRQLFQAFNRLGAESTEIEGTGIGLCLTKKIVEEMGGNIGLVSVEGKGSTFWIELPVTQ